MKGFSLLILAFFITSCSMLSLLPGKHVDVSPYAYGLGQARTGVERYEALLNAHKAALELGVNVDYTGIDTVWLEIPQNPTRIPLTGYNDFGGCVFIIKNTSKVTYLFEKEKKGTAVVLDGQLIDSGNFRSVESLRSGNFLLLVEDDNPWVANRKGYSYGHKRKDILFIKNGLAVNTVTMPYNNVYSAPKCSYIRVDDEPLVIKNLTIERAPGCTFVTNISLISGVNDVRISNVKVHTPASTLKDDRGFLIRSCTNVSMDNVRIEGTYSQVNHSGYGVYLDNIWNFKASNMYGKANWGIFGNNNINVAVIEDSQINRFDIHCYGRDISFKNVSFFDLYNQFSSVYGTIRFDGCIFTDFVPVLNGGSYNAYVGHEIIFRDCVFNATPQNNQVIRFGNLNGEVNERKELTEKCLPNVTIKNLRVNLTGGADTFYLFYGKQASKNAKAVGYLSRIDIDGLTIMSDEGMPVKSMSLSNVKLKTRKDVDCQIKDVVVIRKGALTKSAQSEKVLLKMNLPLKGGKVTMKNVKNLKLN